MDVKENFVPQAGALALYEGRVCLISSRSGKRWVVPKGMIDPGRSAAETALAEAWEEAGIKGNLSNEPIGNFTYEKMGRPHRAELFILVVTSVADDWPERSFRRRLWLDPAEAASKVSEPDLREMLLELANGVAA